MIMKLSELINQLEAFKAEHGDVEAFNQPAENSGSLGSPVRLDLSLIRVSPTKGSYRQFTYCSGIQSEYARDWPKAIEIIIE